MTKALASAERLTIARSRPSGGGRERGVWGVRGEGGSNRSGGNTRSRTRAVIGIKRIVCE